MLKKFVVIVMVMVVLSVMVIGCAQETNVNQNQENSNTDEVELVEIPSSPEQSREVVSEGVEEIIVHNPIIVYYSNTGNTKSVVNILEGEQAGKRYELELANPYTKEDLDYNNAESRVSQEHVKIESGESVDVEFTNANIDNWDEFDVVYIGYPIWYGEPSWVIQEFVKNTDFTGKEVIPFCTYESDDVDAVAAGKVLEDLSGTGNWHKGWGMQMMDIKRDEQ